MNAILGVFWHQSLQMAHPAIAVAAQEQAHEQMQHVDVDLRTIDAGNDARTLLAQLIRRALLLSP
ncbi:hypothetical protein D3C77_742840 [compost metagenome]